MKLQLTSIVIMGILIFPFCSINKTCSNDDFSFDSYDSALRGIKSTSFTYYDEFEPSNDWMGTVTFFSCDKKDGFLIIEIRHEEYIYQEVPIKIWKNFKAAESPGSFYSRNIKGNYQFQLTN